VREIERIVRKGHVRHVGCSEIALDGGTIPTDSGQVHVDWIAGQIITQRAQAAWSAAPDVTAWLDRSRLNAARGIAQRMSEPAMRAVMKRLMASTEPGVASLERLRAAAG
jgi:hypothetical protein